MQVTTIPPRETRKPRPVTAERKQKKDTYAALMREKLGFTVIDCEYYLGGSPVLHRCPLWDLCQQLERQREELFCEVSDAELSLVTVKPGTPEREPGFDEGVLWTDTPLHLEVTPIVTEYVDKTGFFGGEW